VDPAAVTSHSVLLTSLTSNTTYHYRVRSVNNGAPVTSGDFTFSTPPLPVISNVTSTLIHTTFATITWSTDVAADSEIDYGPTTAYGAIYTDPSNVTSHNLTLTGLTQGTTYHYRVRSANGGPQTTSGDFTFATTLP